ncbi:hypothetical protein Hypma_014914 [Hypsizygus marmoreus]|uniref:SHSP domain-containing protein n=1 Tax=Hypsizygus marmoreus TaxID=39966 RepID=A0A369K9G2_HYPMA|nr:hypothetical protein Hypma_014914 [Hypsizygus marmoreus]
MVDKIGHLIIGSLGANRQDYERYINQVSNAVHEVGRDLQIVSYIALRLYLSPRFRMQGTFLRTLPHVASICFVDARLDPFEFYKSIPSPGVKMCQVSPSDQSYFSSAPAYSTIPVTTPLLETPPSARYSSSTCSTPNSPASSEPDMLQHLARCFPPPPALSLSTLRCHSAPESVSPHISTAHRSPRYETPPSPMDRSRRSPPLSYFATMDISSVPAKHTLHVQLPPTIQPEMITISANRGDRLKVVADAWHLENDCHYEWLITFPPRDVDMTAVHAKFEQNGHLFIDVRRIGSSSFGR